MGSLKRRATTATAHWPNPTACTSARACWRAPGAAVYTAIAAGNFCLLCATTAPPGSGATTPWGNMDGRRPITACTATRRCRWAACRQAYAPWPPAWRMRWHWTAPAKSGPGRTANGKLGIGATSASWAPPTRVALTGHFVAIACGAEFSMALRDDGVLFMWGWDETGQLGQGVPRGVGAPPLVPGLPPIREMDGGSGPLGHALEVGSTGPSGPGAATTTASWVTVRASIARRRCASIEQGERRCTQSSRRVGHGGRVDGLRRRWR